jgi:hypothetical protein
MCFAQGDKININAVAIRFAPPELRSLAPPIPREIQVFLQISNAGPDMKM